MESYHVISGLKIKGAEIVSEITKEPVFEYQGSADGSCGPYSLFMALKIAGILYNENLLPNNKIDARTGIGKFMKKIQSFPHLLMGGTFLQDICDLVNHNFASRLKVELSKSQNQELIEFVIDKLKANRPTITGIEYKGGGHWMLAVGYQSNEKGKIIKLLFLDPSGSKPTIAPWNSIVDISSNKKSEFPYKWITNGNAVLFDEALSLY